MTDYVFLHQLMASSLDLYSTALLAQGYGEFLRLITYIQVVLYGLTTLGFLTGCAMKAVAGSDEEKHATAHKMIGTCLTAAIFVYLAPGIYDLMFSWTGS